MLALPMDLDHPADPLEEALLYHRIDRFGFVPLLVHTHDVNVDGRLMPVRPQRTYRLDELPEALRVGVSMNSDVWITQNEFFKPNRRLVNLGRLTVCFADLDYYKLSTALARPEAVAAAILAHCEGTGVPKPNLIINSGRGLQIKWLLDPLPAAALPRWNAVQRAIGQSFTAFGSDARAQDASRVLRLVGSYNIRSGLQVRVLYADTTKPYEFESLADAFLPFSRQELAELRAQRAERQQHTSRAHRSPHDTAAVPTGLRALSIRQLWWDRLSDLRALMRLRGWATVPEGHRDIILWLAAVALTWVLPLPWLRRELAELGREFGGTLSETERLRCLTATLARAEQAASGHLIEVDGKPLDPRYRLSNARLIDLLQVTPEEERQLKTIVSAGEARRRHAERENARRAAQRTADSGLTRADYLAGAESKRQAARLLRAQAWSYRRIATELDISLGSVAGYCQDLA